MDVYKGILAIWHTTSANGGISELSASLSITVHAVFIDRHDMRHSLVLLDPFGFVLWFFVGGTLGAGSLGVLSGHAFHRTGHSWSERHSVCCALFLEHRHEKGTGVLHVRVYTDTAVQVPCLFVTLWP